ncbi:MAG: hypothetical protein GW946_02055 [Candidatus Pacebacteria bacterium]|nr:hypothetical protein [Candidatus Paceibacterota bacterium]PIR60217.1 MAG: hypothetical protein COU67_03070 [Candidatus Pacebacteria bacterium CG10_big_fil_rev_8_21_14_0_10_44_54]
MGRYKKEHERFLMKALEEGSSELPESTQASNVAQKLDHTRFASDLESRALFPGWEVEINRLFAYLSNVELMIRDDGSTSFIFPPVNGIEILTLAALLSPTKSNTFFSLIDWLFDWQELLDSKYGYQVESLDGLSNFSKQPSKASLLQMHEGYAGFTHFFREGPKILSAIVNGLNASPESSFSLHARAVGEILDSAHKVIPAMQGNFHGFESSTSLVKPGFVVSRVETEGNEKARYQIKPIPEEEGTSYSLILGLVVLVFLNNSIVPSNDFEPRIASEHRKHYHQFMSTNQVFLLICKYFFGGDLDGEYGIRLKENVFRQLDEILATQAQPAPQDS